MSNENSKVSDFILKISKKEDLNFFISKNSDNGYCVEFEYWSGLGEDVIISLVFDGEMTIKKIIKEMEQYRDNFDAEEHAGELFNMKGKRGTPTSLRALLQDADEQQTKLDKIYETMRELSDVAL